MTTSLIDAEFVHDTARFAVIMTAQQMDVPLTAAHMTHQHSEMIGRNSHQPMLTMNGAAHTTITT